jgi:excisionase family DNA binding protein
MIETKFLTVQEAADLMRVKLNTVYAWLHRDPTFPRVSIKRRVVIPKQGLQDWINHQQEPQMKPVVVTL